jgi:retron-type reverse transcriptase
MSALNGFQHDEPLSRRKTGRNAHSACQSGLTNWCKKSYAPSWKPTLSRSSQTTRMDARPQRGCHTALREIYHHWRGVTWLIQGDIAQCFEKLSHAFLIEVLKEHIHDGRFIKLVQELLDAGDLENWTYNQTLSGVPQGGIVSPILSTILLDKLDTFVENVLNPTLHQRKEEKGQSRV